MFSVTLVAGGCSDNSSIHIRRSYEKGHTLLAVSLKQATGIVQLLTDFVTRRSVGDSKGGTWAVGYPCRVLLSYNTSNHNVSVCTEAPGASLNFQASESSMLLKELSAVLGLTPSTNVDTKFVATWLGNVAVGLLMICASLLLLLPPFQRTRFLYQWLIRLADGVALSNEARIIESNTRAKT